jgi:hypothetical protein
VGFESAPFYGASVLEGIAAGPERGVVLPPIALELVLEATDADLKQAGRLCPVAMSLLEGPENVAALHLSER